MALINKYILHFLILLLTITFRSLNGQCLSVTLPSNQACIELIRAENESLKKLRKIPAGTIQALFYRYFSEPNYAEFKKLFLPSDWFGLTETDFKTWRAFLKNAHIETKASYTIHTGNLDLGVIKYTYIIDDQEVFETFTAKRIGTSWHPTSAKEEQSLIPLTNIVKYTNADYLQTLKTASRNHSSSNSELMTDGNLVPEKIMANKDSVKMNRPEDYKLRYNDDFKFTSDDKFKADRKHDAEFKTFLTQMNLSETQIEAVMNLMLAQDYMLAAKVADEYSSATYTFMPFVDKIRELYGIDRIKKWDQANNKWD